MPPSNDLALYLVLSPEFGGTRFGPFEQNEVRLGSNRERSHIVIPEAMGVLADHVRLLREGDRAFRISPVERSAAIFLFRGDGRRPEQVLSATACQPGDSFTLVSPQGPRFRLELAPLPPEIQAQRQKGRRTARGLTAGRFFSEAKRMFFATLYTLSPVALAARAMHYVQSGLIWQPRILITGALLLLGWAGLGVTSCRMAAYRAQTVQLTEDYEACEQEKKGYRDATGDDLANLDVPGLVGRALGAPDVGKALADDPDLGAKVEAVARELFLAPASEWAWARGEGASTDFSRLRAALAEADGLDATSRRVLPFLAAWPDTNAGAWSQVVDSADQRVCGRGPLRLTWRQGRQLGLGDVQLDAFEERDVALVEQDAAQRLLRLQRTFDEGRVEGEPTPPDDIPTNVARIGLGRGSCVYAEGADDREDLGALVRMVRQQLGERAAAVAPVDRAPAAVTRVAKFHAADVPLNWYAGDLGKKPLLDFSPGLVGQALQSQKSVVKSWVVERTAYTLARSVVLPCRAVLEADVAVAEQVFGEAPRDYPCLILHYKLTR